MIPVRAVCHVLIAHLRIDTTDYADDVICGHVLKAVLHGRIDDDACRHWSEIARLCLLPQRRHVEASLREQSGRCAIGDPAANGNWGWERRIPRQETMLSRVRIHHDVPGVARRACRVHDEHARRAAAFGFLILVRPAAVVRHRLAAEKIRLRRRSGRIVHKHEQDFAANVGALEVVPLVLGSSRAIADEHQLATCVAGGGRGSRPDDDILGEAKASVGFPRCGDLDGLRVGLHDVNWNTLEVRGVSNSGPQTKGFELRCNVFLGYSASAGGWGAAFEQVGGEKTQVGVDLFGSYPRRRRAHLGVSTTDCQQTCNGDRDSSIYSVCVMYVSTL